MVDSRPDFGTGAGGNFWQWGWIGGRSGWALGWARGRLSVDLSSSGTHKIQCPHPRIDMQWCTWGLLDGCTCWRDVTTMSCPCGITVGAGDGRTPSHAAWFHTTPKTSCFLHFCFKDCWPMEQCGDAQIIPEIIVVMLPLLLLVTRQHCQTCPRAADGPGPPVLTCPLCPNRSMPAKQLA